jgi:hypothetical protein
MKSFDFLEGRRVSFFQAVQGCLVPRAQEFTSQQQQESLKIINDFLHGQGHGVRFKLKLFFFFIDFLSCLWGLRPFRYLGAQKQKAVMTFLFDCPIPVLRKGFWGLNTLAKLGVYGQPSIYPDMGYKLKGNTDERKSA